MGRKGAQKTKHTYIVLACRAVGNPDAGYGFVYDFDGRYFKQRGAAIKHGFTLGRSDDFNIGVLAGGSLISLDWMNEPVDTDPHELAAIAEHLGFRDPMGHTG